MRVISFSIWGNDQHFYDGALANIELAKQYYPDWECWFFIRRGGPVEAIREIVKRGASVHHMDETKGPWEGLFWRFAPIGDPFVSHTLSRDCDSRLNPREAVAVKEWVESGLLFHSMRDHYEHQVPIMGGMFGCRHWPRLLELCREWPDYSCKGIDQKFLAEKIWPDVVLRSVTHDRYPLGMSMPIPTAPFVYHYKPIDFFGAHDIRAFPDHPNLDPVLHGEHVGARVGVPQ